MSSERKSAAVSLKTSSSRSRLKSGSLFSAKISPPLRLQYATSSFTSMSRSRRAAAETGSLPCGRSSSSSLIRCVLLSSARSISANSARASSWRWRVIASSRSRLSMAFARRSFAWRSESRRLRSSSAVMSSDKSASPPTTEYTLNSVEGTADVRNDTMP